MLQVIFRFVIVKSFKLLAKIRIHNAQHYSIIITTNAIIILKDFTENDLHLSSVFKSLITDKNK